MTDHDVTMKLKVPGLKMIDTQRLVLETNGMRLTMYVDAYTGRLVVMESGSMASHLSVYPEVANVIKIGITRN